MKYLLYGALFLMLQGCHINDTKKIVPTHPKVACESFKIITYDSQTDSKETYTQIIEHNEVYKAICKNDLISH